MLAPPSPHRRGVGEEAGGPPSTAGAWCRRVTVETVMTDPLGLGQIHSVAGELEEDVVERGGPQRELLEP